MPSSVDQLYKQAMKLSAEARETLAARLMGSVGAGTIKLHPEWDEEIRRRVEDLKTGRVKPHSLKEAMRIIMDDSDEPARSRNSSARHKRRKNDAVVVRKA